MRAPLPPVSARSAPRCSDWPGGPGSEEGAEPGPPSRPEPTNPPTREDIMTEIQTTAVIHYQSPESDPLKVPRPTRITADADGEIITTGGEGDLRGDKLIGLSRVDGPPPTFDPEDWVDARDILDADPTEA